MSTILNLNIQAPLCSFHVPQDAALVHPSVGRCAAKFLHRSNVLTARRQEILQATSFLLRDNLSSRDCGVSPNKRAFRRSTDVCLTRDARFEKSHSWENKELAPRARFELATLRLTAECSTIELPGIRTTHLFSF